MIEEKEISASCAATIKKRIKYLEANDPNNVILKLLKYQISEHVSEYVSEKSNTKIRSSSLNRKTHLFFSNLYVVP